jgi:hypothetical protein
MVNIYLTTDPETHRALYDSESRFLGLFQSIRDAYEALGDLLSYCTIRSAN